MSENAPVRLRPGPEDSGAKEGTRFADAACGRNHTLLVESDGQVCSVGANSLGQVCITCFFFPVFFFFQVQTPSQPRDPQYLENSCLGSAEEGQHSNLQ
ncbi:hypothetical protein VKT23_016138 [Stygiomarasmius scandens]|uniref:Uncharacterized protein n=1 Tax=Marasmiellus scandens TaxID=2682957 RepID=A0ABR1IVV5_9AGAR